MCSPINPLNRLLSLLNIEGTSLLSKRCSKRNVVIFWTIMCSTFCGVEQAGGEFTAYSSVLSLDYIICTGSCSVTTPSLGQFDEMHLF